MTVPPEPDAQDPTSAALAALATEYWDTMLELAPLAATSLGDPRHDDRLDDPTPEGRAAARRRLAALLDRARSLDLAALGDQDRVTLSTMRDLLVGDIAGLDTGVGEWNVNPLDGLPVTLLNVPDYQRLQSPGDGRSMVARWRAMGPYIDAQVANLRRTLGEGRVATRAPVERAADILRELLASPDDDWPLLAPLAGIGELEGWTTTDRGRLADDLRAAVATIVRPAFVRLHTTLVDIILPAARSNERPGLGHVPGGEAAYRQLIRLHTSLDVDARSLHETGLAEIERIDAELAELTGRVLGTRQLDAALERMRSDPALAFTTSDEVFETAVRALARANEATPDWFGRLPQAPCAVVRMGAHEERHSTIAYYRQPAIDGSRPGQYYLNTSEPGTRPRYEAEALAYHEAVPGHHLQIAIAQELPHLPEFRRHLGPTAFFEGWGLYTERLSDEMGLYSGDFDRIGVLSFDAWRAGRLVVDTGMHALGWTRDQAIEFMHAHSALAINNITNEIDRYIVDPGQALAYKTGQLEILRLRRDAEQRLGSRFDIRRFHDALLEHGAVGLPTLASIIARWVEDLAAS
jgi:uncharacterized protein (DUF885 family)